MILSFFGEILQEYSYKELKSCKNGIASIKKNAPDAKIVQE
ncbi:MAG: YegP family protein [Eubacterium sp.]|nr:YegP family protein [Eubacterium sp.]